MNSTTTDAWAIVSHGRSSVRWIEHRAAVADWIERIRIAFTVSF